MKTLYLDIFSGISGDMFLGAMIDLGVSETEIESELKKLGLEGWHIHTSREKRFEIEGVKFDAHIHDHEERHAAHHHHTHEPLLGLGHHHHHSSSIRSFAPVSEPHFHGRSYAQIVQLIDGADFSGWVKEKAKAVFERIAVAEGKIHGMPTAEVHFHEVGALDSIIDIIGGCVALEKLGKPRVLAGPVVEGTGWIQCAHGRFPIPAPATLEIFAARGASITQCDEPHELITPTGAALLAEFAESFGPLAKLAPEKIGFGIGTRHNKTRPNVLRAVLGTIEAGGESYDWETDQAVLLESNLDDCSAEIVGSVIERAMANGALDVFASPVQMKKNRPGVLLSILCEAADADRFSEMILTETSAFGIRRTQTERRKLKRTFEEISTRYGQVRMKLGSLNGKIVQVAPEYETCRLLAEQNKVAVKEVYLAALGEWRRVHA